MNKYISKIFLLASSALLFISCAKLSTNGNDANWAPLSFSSSDGALEVKATQQTSVTDFTVTGYTNSSIWFPQTNVNTSATYDTYKWLPGATHTFYGYANLPSSGASATITSSGVTLKYTSLPTDANQKDAMLGLYDGNGGGSGTAAMTFYHPLASVAFEVGDIVNVAKITKITLQGLYSAGQTTLNTSTPVVDNVASFSWTDRSGNSSVSQDVSGNLPSKGSRIGSPFIVIPQTLSSKNVIVTITAVTEVGNLTQTITATLSTGSFDTGKTTVYKINYSATSGLSFTSSVTAWSANAEEGLELKKREQATDEIWYDWSYPKWMYPYYQYSWPNDAVIGPESKTWEQSFGVDLVSSTYDTDSKGVFKFSGPVESCDIYFSYINPGNYGYPTDRPDGGGSELYSSISSLSLPSSVRFINININKASACPDELVVPDYVEEMEIHNWCNYLKYIIFCGVRYDVSKEGTYTFNLYNGTTGHVYTGDPTCFAKGTLITLADGNKKSVENINYDDVLKVWNFDTGSYDSAKVLWLLKRDRVASHYYKVTLSDSTVLNVVGAKHAHRLYNYTDRFFEGTTYITPGKEIFTENGIVKLVSCERIDEEVEYFNLITDKHINCFANGVLTSARYNNTYPIDQDMKFIKDDRKIRPYREFRKAGISREWYDGMRLGEQTDSLARIKAYIDKCDARQMPRPESTHPGFFTKIWNWIKGLFGR